jgi:hypothetical protein
MDLSKDHTLPKREYVEAQVDGIPLRAAVCRRVDHGQGVILVPWYSGVARIGSNCSIVYVFSVVQLSALHGRALLRSHWWPGSTVLSRGFLL